MERSVVARPRMEVARLAWTGRRRQAGAGAGGQRLAGAGRQAPRSLRLGRRPEMETGHIWRPVSVGAQGSRTGALLLQLRILAQRLGAVGLLPRERGEAVAVGVRQLLRDAPEVAVAGGLLVHRVDQVEHLEDAVGAQVEVLADQLLDLVVAEAAGAEGGDRDRGGVGYADRVADLHLAEIGDAGGDDVLGHVDRK